MFETENKRALAWIVGDDTGVSSEFIWSHFMGVVNENPWPRHPLDPSDFGRCARLLEIMPEWRSRISEMSKYSEPWKALTERWSDIYNTFKEECGLYGEKSNKAPKTYQLMRSILKDR